MSDPTPETRRGVYVRDDYRCANCGKPAVTFQHRRAVGMGGSKVRPGATDGLALCGTCNEACEHRLQTMALAFGWKVRRWADPTKVPVYYRQEWQWYRLEGLERIPISAVVALDMMHAVYGDQYFKWRAEIDAS